MRLQFSGHAVRRMYERQIGVAQVRAVMNCMLCRNGTTKPGHVTVTLERGNTTIVLKEVPAEVCENCGEYYLSAEVADRVLAQGEKAAAAGVEVEIARYAA